MKTDWIKQETSPDGVLTLTLDAGPVNALTADRLDAFADVIEGADAAAIVICSTHRVLSAGLDLKYAQGADAAEARRIVQGLNRAFLSLYASPRPVVCAAAGAAIAGGLFFVLASDWRVAGEGAKFGLAEVLVGVDFPAGPLGIARAELGAAEARRLMLPGQPIPAAAAQARGIVDEVVPRDQVLVTAQAKAKALAQIPAAAYARVKSQLRGETIAAIRAAEKAEADADRPWIDDKARAAMARMLA
ncbi:MAG: enoyl-CoA hydratase/isomerase family protein [Pseudomonadota bacterium]